jgi:hypothetical protein
MPLALPFATSTTCRRAVTLIRVRRGFGWLRRRRGGLNRLVEVEGRAAIAFGDGDLGARLPIRHPLPGSRAHPCSR